MNKANHQSAAPSGRADGKIHLHVENTGELGPVFEASPDRVAAALKDHPDVAERLHVTIGYDGDIIERELPDADILFAWNFDRGNLAARAPRLKWVHAHGAGVNHLMPLTWLPRGAVLTNSRGVHAERASEYARANPGPRHSGANPNHRRPGCDCRTDEHTGPGTGRGAVANDRSQAGRGDARQHVDRRPSR